ncbi:MAG: hypothetical protein PHN31_04555 [Candidatus Gracilibacteria bacterium]|nr:hypothetical protein [Candidatus Gracilibacteria bacterium]
MIKKILLYLVPLICFTNIGINNIYATSGDVSLNSGAEVKSNYDTIVNSASKNSGADNDLLDDLHNNGQVGESASGNKTGAVAIKDFIIIIAKEVKNIFFVLAGIYFLIITIRFLVSGSSDEAFGKYKKGIIWITIGIVVMQLSYSFVVTIFDRSLSSFASNFIGNIIEPLINLISTLASIFFLFIAIYTFIRLMSSGGDKEKLTKGINSILYAVIGIALIKFSRILVEGIYGTYGINQAGTITITTEKGFSSVTIMFFNFMNWLNGFVAIGTVIMIIYAGTQILLSNGDTEKVKKGRKLILYAGIGIMILASSYLFLSFFIGPEGNNITTNI